MRWACTAAGALLLVFDLSTTSTPSSFSAKLPPNRSVLSHCSFTGLFNPRWKTAFVFVELQEDFFSPFCQLLKSLCTQLSALPCQLLTLGLVLPTKLNSVTLPRSQVEMSNSWIQYLALKNTGSNQLLARFWTTEYYYLSPMLLPAFHPFYSPPTLSILCNLATRMRNNKCFLHFITLSPYHDLIQMLNGKRERNDPCSNPLLQNAPCHPPYAFKTLFKCTPLGICHFSDERLQCCMTKSVSSCTEAQNDENGLPSLSGRYTLRFFNPSSDWI